MPVISGQKYKNVKVERPNGTRYVSERRSFRLYKGEHAWELHQGWRRLMEKWNEEFDDNPQYDSLVMEVAFDSTGFEMTLFEIREP